MSNSHCFNLHTQKSLFYRSAGFPKQHCLIYMYYSLNVNLNEWDLNKIIYVVRCSIVAVCKWNGDQDPEGNSRAKDTRICARNVEVNLFHGNLSWK